MLSLSARILLADSNPVRQCLARRCTSSAKPVINQNEKETQKEWQITSFSKEMESLKLMNLNHHEERRVSKPNDVLIKVKAASINPIDLKIAEGYGDRIFAVMRNIARLTGSDKVTYDKFPMTLGRDFSGVVVAKGSSANNITIGDEVMGFVPLSSTRGSHASHVITESSFLIKKGSSLSHTQAACLPYAGVTAISAVTIAGLFKDQCFDKRVLVLGGTGGVGSLMIQILKAYGAHVVAACSPNGKDWLFDKTDVDEVVSYHNDYNELGNFTGFFDVVINCAPMSVGSTIHPIVLMSLKRKKPGKTWCGGTYVTLTTPLLDNVDSYGIPFGLIRSGIQITKDNVKGCTQHGISCRWAFFTPSGQILKLLDDLVLKGKVKPIIDSTFNFTDVPTSYGHFRKGHARGKIVLNM